MKATPGIRVRHGRTCRSRADGSCNCKPAYEAWVYSARDKTKIRRTFTGKGALSAAKGWRNDAASGVRKGTTRAPTQTTLREAATTFLAGAEAGTIRVKNGQPYRPSALRGYRRALDKRILPDLGARKLGDISRFDLQDLVDRLLAEGLAPSSIQNTLMPLRAIYRRAVHRGDVAVNPTALLEIPTGGEARDRIAAPDEAVKLLAALPVGERALWATAIYAGLRRGELLALAWEHVDFERGVITVERAWDPDEKVMMPPKTKAGRRNVPLVSTLRAHLREHQLVTARRSGLVFGEDGETPLDPDTLRRQALRTWAKVEPEALVPIGLHECRHTFASLMIAAGVNAKGLSTYMGHSSVTITYDRYGHLMPGNEDEAAGLLDAYLEQATTRVANGG
jgi:integrase